MPDQAAMPYAYDAFISYSHTNYTWVWRELLPRLEAAGLRACIDERDFRPGTPSVKEMERAVQSSRKTLLVLTPAYLQSAWTEFEALMLQTIDPANRALRLIPLLLERCELPPRLSYLTYVNLADPGDPERAWARLLAALGADPAMLGAATKTEATPATPGKRTRPAPMPEEAMPASAWHPSLDALRDALAELYGTEGDWRTFVASAGLQANRIDARGSMHTVWHATLGQARAQDRLEAVMALALREYPRYRPLQQACAACRAWLAEEAGAGSRPAAPIRGATSLGSEFRDLKLDTLRRRRDALVADYEAANQELDATLGEVERTRIKRQIAMLEREISDVDRALKDLQP